MHNYCVRLILPNNRSNFMWLLFAQQQQKIYIYKYIFYIYKYNILIDFSSDHNFLDSPKEDGQQPFSPLEKSNRSGGSKDEVKSWHGAITASRCLWRVFVSIVVAIRSVGKEKLEEQDLSNTFSRKTTVFGQKIAFSSIIIVRDQTTSSIDIYLRYYSIYSNENCPRYWIERDRSDTKK